MMKLESRPAIRLQAKVDGNATRTKALDQLKSVVAAFKTAVDGLKAGTALDAFSVAANGVDGVGRSVLSATVGSGAATGSYAVRVEALATAQKRSGTVGWSATQKAGALANVPDDAVVGTLTIGGEPIEVKGADTIGAVRDRINAAAARTGVRATVLSLRGDGSDQRLVLTGTRTGAANAFTIGDDGESGLLGALGLAGANATEAADARFRVDGSDPITRPTNSVGDVIPGVTVALSAVGDAAVTVSRQAIAAPAAVQGMVDAYNKITDLVKAQRAANAPLNGEAMLRTLTGTLVGALLTPAPTGEGSPVASDLRLLSAIGVTVQKDGKLAFDAAKLDEAYPARADAVKALLADRMGALSQVADGLSASFSGAIDRRQATMRDQDLVLTARIDDINVRLEKKRASLLAQFSRFEGSLGRLKAIGDNMNAQFTGMINSMGKN
jgi:flagellar hook-associated protein 2